MEYNKKIMNKLPQNKKLKKEVEKGGRKYFANDKNRMWYQTQIGLNLVQTVWNDLLTGGWMESDFAEQWINKLADVAWRYYHRFDKEAPVVLSTEAAKEAIEKTKLDLESDEEIDNKRLLARMKIALQLIDVLYAEIDKHGLQNKQEVLDFADALNERSVKY